MNRAITFEDKKKRNEEIKKQYATGKYSMYELSRLYGLTQPMIHKIVKQKNINS